MENEEENEEVNDEQEHKLKLSEVAEYLSLNKLLKDQVLLRDGKEYTLDMKELIEQEPEVHNLFISHPDELKGMFLDKIRFVSPETKLFKIKNFSYLHPISILRAEHIQTLVKVSGMITKTTKVISLVTQRKWECGSCGTILTTNGTTPKGCSCGRRGGFRELSVDLLDVQEVELEELQEDLGERQPQKIRVRFLDKLCDKDISAGLQPGNKIEVIGTVEKIQVPKAHKTKDDNEELFEYRILAYDLNQLEEKFDKIQITEQDEQDIREIAAGDPLKKLADSLAPSIYGHDDIKKALILQMAGGVSEIKSDGLPTRGRIHILICGDASTGKSKIAKNVNKKMPRSYYVSGDEVTKVGLTSMVDKDPLLGNWALKAGALCKCNDSVLVIDEMDKINKEDLNALHTPMESGLINVDKADIHTTLKADCSILAISNPKEGSFVLGDSAMPLTRQINLPSPLLTRFDLIFVVTDKIDATQDAEIVRKIFFRNKSDEVEIMSADLFKKYILYAKSIKPEKSEEYLPALIEFYNNVRRRSVSLTSNLQGMPITTRHIEGIIRLATAHAKIRLSRKIEKVDFEVARDLFMNSLLKLGMDEETGLVDFARVGSATTLTKKIKFGTIRNIIRESYNNGINVVPLYFIQDKALDKGLSKYETEELVDELKRAGELFEPRNGFISFVNF